MPPSCAYRLASALVRHSLRLFREETIGNPVPLAESIGSVMLAKRRRPSRSCTTSVAFRCYNIRVSEHRQTRTVRGLKIPVDSGCGDERGDGEAYAADGSAGEDAAGRKSEAGRRESEEVLVLFASPAKAHYPYVSRGRALSAFCALTEKAGGEHSQFLSAGRLSIQ